jgi:hypothetical protein
VSAFFLSSEATRPSDFCDDAVNDLFKISRSSCDSILRYPDVKVLASDQELARDAKMGKGMGLVY